MMETYQIKNEVIAVESILCVDIPVQMISCTDTNGKITPLIFRFKDKTGELISVTIGWLSNFLHFGTVLP